MWMNWLEYECYQISTGSLKLLPRLLGVGHVVRREEWADVEGKVAIDIHFWLAICFLDQMIVEETFRTIEKMENSPAFLPTST